MSMQALNQLVARSIIDPTIVDMFSNGNITQAMEGLDFNISTRTYLSEIEAQTWSEFAILAYRYVKQQEEMITHIDLPSPLEGIVDENGSRSTEQVA